ncbi:MAG: hypothetical protein IKA27_00245 [Elusimicrobiaceae bacterium]|nr:hypothetical protein [Elusimicrobiaceae bacterium]
MKIGLIDVDGHNFPNIPLMKLSAWHKAQGHEVEWYDPMFSGHKDRVYVSKVFSFSPYVMLYDKEHIPRGHELRKLQRWVNNRFIFHSTETFEEYLNGGRNE